MLRLLSLPGQLLLRPRHRSGRNAAPLGPPAPHSAPATRPMLQFEVPTPHTLKAATAAGGRTFVFSNHAHTHTYAGEAPRLSDEKGRGSVDISFPFCSGLLFRHRRRLPIVVLPRDPRPRRSTECEAASADDAGFPVTHEGCVRPRRSGAIVRTAPLATLSGAVER